jgi:hypothetical protein
MRRPTSSGTHINRLAVTYLGIQSPHTPEAARPQEAIELAVKGGMTLDPESVRQEVEQLPGYRPDDPTQTHVPFVLDQRLRHFSWGTDGQSLEFVTRVATDGLVVGLVVEGLKRLGRWALARVDDDPAAEALNEQAAIIWAKGVIADRFDVPDARLTVLGFTLTGSSATVVLRADDGSTFTAVRDDFTEDGHVGFVTHSM